MTNSRCYKYIVHLSVCLILVIPFVSCQKDTQDAEGTIVRVYDKVLTRADVQALIPENATVADSADIVDRYVQEWVSKELILQKARINVGSSPDIDKMVEDYRNSLIISKYTELLVDQKASVEVADKEIVDFYNENIETYKLDEQIVTGIFLQIPADAPKIEDLHVWLKDRTEDDLLELENYSFQNASKYEDFTQKWLPVSVIGKYIPLDLSAYNLKKNVTIEESDSLSRYFLVVFDTRKKGDEAPLIYVRPQIIKVLQHKKRLEYLIRFKKDILKEAVEQKKVVYYDATSN